MKFAMSTRFALAILLAIAAVASSALLQNHGVVQIAPASAHMRPVEGQMSVNGFSWKNCGPSSDALQIISLSIPDPLVLGGQDTFAGQVSLKVAVTNTTSPSVSLTIKKKILGIYTKIPCIDNVGSCTYDDGCSKLKDQDPCPDPLPQYGLPCHCPFQPGTYTLPSSTFDVKVPKGVPSWLTNGDYQVTAQLTQGGSELGCINLEFSLKEA